MVLFIRDSTWSVDLLPFFLNCLKRLVLRQHEFAAFDVLVDSIKFNCSPALDSVSSDPLSMDFELAAQQDFELSVVQQGVFIRRYATAFV